MDARPLAAGDIGSLGVIIRSRFCGNAVYSCRPQFVHDTYSDARWSDLRQFAYDFGLRACWSMPLFSASGDVINSFALSSFKTRFPFNFHKKLLEIGASIIGIVLDRRQARERIRLYEQFYKNSGEGMLILDRRRKIIPVNQAFTGLTGGGPVRQRPEISLAGGFPRHSGLMEGLEGVSPVPSVASLAGVCRGGRFFDSLEKRNRPASTQPFMPGSQGRPATRLQMPCVSFGQPQPLIVSSFDTSTRPPRGRSRSGANQFRQAGP